MKRCVATCLVAWLVSAAAGAQDLASFERRMTSRVLANGLTVLVCERPEAPVFSFFTHVDVGSDREVAGITGLAHMFEHMAFKGTDEIGTSDYAAETAALAKVEEAYRAYDAERRRAPGPDADTLARLEREWHTAIDAADRYVVPEEFSEIVEREGGVGLNAFTSNDETGYFYSLPSNRLELWAYLESARFLHPVTREFYKERDVVMEERRMRTDSQPIGRLLEQFLAAAYTAHAYGRPVVGWPSDLQSFSAADAVEFHRRHYIPPNMVVTVVGDVKAAEAVPIIERYFGRLPAAPPEPPVRTVEPSQRSERTVVIREATQPIYVEGYHKGSATDPDDAVFDVLGDLLSNGRTSRLYRSLVRDKRIAAYSAGFPGLPGNKYPNLFVVYAVPTPGHTPGELRDAIREQIERLRSQDVAPDELAMVKTRAKADLIRQLDSNQGLAVQLGTAQARFGDWRELFGQVDRIEAVTAADVRRVASAAFVAENRTVGIIESVAPAPAGGQ